MFAAPQSADIPPSYLAQLQIQEATVYEFVRSRLRSFESPVASAQTQNRRVARPAQRVAGSRSDKRLRHAGTTGDPGITRDPKFCGGIVREFASHKIDANRNGPSA